MNTPAMVSPFAGSALRAERPAEPGADESSLPGLLSPFSISRLEASADDGELFEQLLAELEDEAFDDAVEALVDEAAAVHLTTPWDGEASDRDAQLEAWSARLLDESRRVLDHLEETFAGRTPESVTEDEIELTAAQARTDTMSPAAEQFLGGLVDKVKSGFAKVKSAAAAVARTGLGVLGRITGLGQLTGILKKLVEPLVTRVLNAARNRLPASLRGPAAALAAKLGLRAPETGREVAQDFDRQYAQALTVTDEAAAEDLLLSAADAGRPAGEDPVADLDAARVRLAAELAAAAPGEAPVAPVEQFVPAVTAAMPLVRTAVRLIGRDRVKRLLAEPLAAFIAPFVGRQAAQSLAPPIADTGLRLLRLEHEEPAVLGSEALVSTLEETVRQVVSLPPESLADDVRVAAEVQEAFAEAAARYLPPSVLRADLGEDQAEPEAGGWIMMPRGPRPRYRYRAYTHPYRVLLSRPAARAIVVSGDETLEERLLDDGVGAWPAEVEVQLFEAMPGTLRGHLAAAAGEDGTLSPDEFGELTPQVAGTLLQRPALGGRPGAGAAGALGTGGARPGAPATPGQRFFRVVVPGRPGRARRVRRLAVRVDLSGPAPRLRVHLRIGERTAHALATQLDRRAHTQVVAAVRRLLGSPARDWLTQRLGRSRALNTPRPMPPERRRALAEALAEGMTTALAKELPAAGPTLARAAQDPAAGLTLTFTFPFAGRAALEAGTPGTPVLAIRPGLRHG
ncbi:hypothetical protein [Jiangella anatolica]|uniref:Uncharacterized protein n=1 Tax=Jiangella anatolica TaxID=2670374 RepID=A0A2W2BTD8_9ACTN|nr:hypothetical protein [Jiangella anatolica]PZF83258.1 hypothetical protein C1I92_13365 [Jiangella anatolica]